jgi:hypothetical protein
MPGEAVASHAQTVKGFAQASEITRVQKTSSPESRSLQGSKPQRSAHQNEEVSQ